eukprot:TRINITY_DN73651_c0_g1_i1.p1 TRINITY_DN73651_c0_g1~~TRINITY_DN73651_c0_g1_i1.p1  ORF type:complete len:147 (-),score=28.47 TRINITY_DN73651_c0_g1_i1:187-627(-)
MAPYRKVVMSDITCENLRCAFAPSDDSDGSYFSMDLFTLRDDSALLSALPSLSSTSTISSLPASNASWRSYIRQPCKTIGDLSVAADMNRLQHGKQLLRRPHGESSSGGAFALGATPDMPDVPSSCFDFEAEADVFLRDARLADIP